MVSVIIAAYNSEKYVKRCLHSITSQTYRDLEIIVVDDGSVDKTREIAESCSSVDSRIRVITQDHAGVGAARNAGLLCATGEYISFVDADDYVDDCFISGMLSAMDDCDMVVVNFVPNPGTIPLLTQENKTISVADKQTLCEDFLVGSLGHSIAYSGCNKLFCREMIQKNGLRFPTNVDVGEDMIFVLQYLMQCEKITVLSSQAYHYCIHDGSTMHQDKDYSDHYEKTFCELKHLSDHGICISDELLGRWAMHIWRSLLRSAYVRSMRYKEFMKYYEHISGLSIFDAVRRCRKAGTPKGNVLRYAIAKRKRRLLYFITTGNR